MAARRFARRSGGVLPLLSLFVPSAALAQALPFLPTGDVRLRHEVQLEVDAGRMPLGTTWPIPTRDVPEARRSELRSTLQPGDGQDAGFFVNGAAKPTRLRTFADTPRENGEVGLQAGWAAGDYAGGAFRVSYAVDPEDDKSFRFDDTYAAWRLGNWWFSAGYQERWWGPGHDGSLILSNNARPLPSVALTRASSQPFETKWLSWIGPWNVTTFMGVFEGDRTDYDNNPLLWGLRVNFRPVEGLEIGLSRTAQWCRPGRCTASAFADVLLGRDNRGENVAVEDEPGNQLAGADLRYRLPRLPAAVYWQFNGESIDNGNYRPRLLTQLVGGEIWGASEGGSSWRAFVEFAGTRCGEFGTDRPSSELWGCAYENGLFTGGYRSRGRVIGHSIDRDSRSYTLGGWYVPAVGPSYEVRLRRMDLNRNAIAAPSPSHSAASRATTRMGAEVAILGAWRGLAFSAGVGADVVDTTGRGETAEGRAFIQLSAPWAKPD
mgnify:CR=1 FL=1